MQPLKIHSYVAAPEECVDRGAFLMGTEFFLLGFWQFNYTGFSIKFKKLDPNFTDFYDTDLLSKKILIVQIKFNYFSKISDTEIGV